MSHILMKLMTAQLLLRPTDQPDSVTITMSLTHEEEQALQLAAARAAENAYAPYSGFRVGAALLLDDGTTVTGCNVENMSYGLTICAERSALVRAISERGASVRVKAIAVTNLNHAASPPCGACRQVLSEFVTEGATISFPSEAGTENLPFATLMPFAFRFAPPATPDPESA
jgi:cytidine deaminase